MLKAFFLNDKNIMALISINAIIIFLQGFPEAEIGAPALKALTYADDIISLLFISELLIKVRHFGLKEYLNNNWNRFDSLLILLSIPPLLIHFFPVQIVELGFLLVFRVFRIFKFFRFVHFFPQVEHIFRSVNEALKASFMVLIGFLVFIFIISILSCFFYQNIAPQYYGNPIQSYYTTFQIFTVEGWNSIPEVICAHPAISATEAFFTKLYFVILLVLGGIFGLSIVNSIFVDAMVSDNNDELEKQVEQIESKLDQLEKKIDSIISKIDNDKSK